MGSVVSLQVRIEREGPLAADEALIRAVMLFAVPARIQYFRQHLG